MLRRREPRAGRRRAATSAPSTASTDTTATPVRLSLPGRADPEGFDRGRQLADKAVYSACYAPMTSMYFDQFGQVRACCQNTGTLLGKVTEQSLRDIWQSASTARMRRALEVRDFSEGCGFCGWQVEQDDVEILYARNFDNHPVQKADPAWPVQMEFSMTNSCNLQCVMCNGDWSSSIRAHREHRPPLPEVYGDQFFDELAEFLPHLRKANFLGGEPFLGREPLRVMDMLAELARPPDVAVTTNGTQWSPRIERICERLPISFVLSLDGVTKETYESIRIGADFDAVMANLERFRASASRHGTTVTLAHCLMRANWHEFSRFLRFAEDRQLDVGMNEVLFPAELSVFQLPAPELRGVVTAMEADRAADGLTVLRHVWDGQLGALRHRLQALEGGEHGFIRPWAGTDGSAASAEPWDQQAVRVLTEWEGSRPPVELRLGGEHPPRLFTSAPHALDHLDLSGVVDSDSLLAALSEPFGSELAIERRYTDMLDDVVIGDRRSTLELRAAWRSSGPVTTAFVAFRHAPPMDLERARRTLHDGAAELEVDASGTIVATAGVEAAFGIAGSELEGLDLPGLVRVLSLHHGGDPSSAAGPSGHPNDAVTTFVDEAGRPVACVRSITVTTASGTLIVTGPWTLPDEGTA